MALAWSNAMNYFYMIDIRIGMNSFYSITAHQISKQLKQISEDSPSLWDTIPWNRCSVKASNKLKFKIYILLLQGNKSEVQQTRQHKTTIKQNGFQALMGKRQKNAKTVEKLCRLQGTLFQKDETTKAKLLCWAECHGCVPLWTKTHPWWSFKCFI